jgi:hypothetical protein
LFAPLVWLLPGYLRSPSFASKEGSRRLLGKASGCEGHARLWTSATSSGLGRGPDRAAAKAIDPTHDSATQSQCH